MKVYQALDVRVFSCVTLPIIIRQPKGHPVEHRAFENPTVNGIHITSLKPDFQKSIVDWFITHDYYPGFDLKRSKPNSFTIPSSWRYDLTHKIVSHQPSGKFPENQW